MACNAPNNIHGMVSSFEDPDYEKIWKLTSDVDICKKHDDKNYTISNKKYAFYQLQFVQVILILIYILTDQFTYRYIKRNVLGCQKKSRKNKK
jgi:hypothetical protein